MCTAQIIGVIGDLPIIELTCTIAVDSLVQIIVILLQPGLAFALRTTELAVLRHGRVQSKLESPALDFILHTSTGIVQTTNMHEENADLGSV